MASTQPAPITLLRVKRARTHTALDALHIHPTKRPRRNPYPNPAYATPEQPLCFRRLPQLADINTLGPSRVIDIDPTLLRTNHDEASSTDSDTILYNGSPMSREFLDNEECMYDLFARGDHPSFEHLLTEDADQNIAWLLDHNLPIFDNDSSDDDLLSDSDDRSVDYPSTPEPSVENLSEDEWRERERQILKSDSYWCDRDNSDNDPDCAPWRDYDADCESEQDGDNYDYEA